MYLYGASGHAKVIIDILRANHEPIEALFDDNEEIHCLFDYPVLRPSKVCGPLIISIGNNGIRRKIAESLHAAFGNAFHPSAIISEEAATGSKYEVGREPTSRPGKADSCYQTTNSYGSTGKETGGEPACCRSC